MSDQPYRKALSKPSRPGVYTVRIVTKTFDGGLIQLDLSDVPEERWRALFANVSPDGFFRAPEPPIHILVRGAALCGKSGPVENWPKGEWWVSIVDKDKATCPTCRAAKSASSA